MYGKKPCRPDPFHGKRIRGCTLLCCIRLRSKNWTNVCFVSNLRSSILSSASYYGNHNHCSSFTNHYTAVRPHDNSPPNLSGRRYNITRRFTTLPGKSSNVSKRHGSKCHHSKSRSRSLRFCSRKRRGSSIT